MKPSQLTLFVLASAVFTASHAYGADAPGLDFDIRIDRIAPVHSDVLVLGERHARMRAAGTALVTLAATMIPTTASAWIFHAKGHEFCLDGGCSLEHVDSRAVDGVFGASLVAEHVMVGAGRYLLTAGYGPRGSQRVGQRSAHGLALRAAGGTLVALATIALPLGVAFAGDESFGAPVAGLGAAMLASGVPIAAAGSYYDNNRDAVSVGTSPLVRKDGDPPGRALTGMVTTVSGRF